MSTRATYKVVLLAAGVSFAVFGCDRPAPSCRDQESATQYAAQWQAGILKQHIEGSIPRADVQPTLDQLIAGRPLLAKGDFAGYCRFIDGLTPVRGTKTP